MMRLTLLVTICVALGAQAQEDNVVTVNIENDAARRFLSEVTYTSPEDTSLVKNYNVAPPYYRDQPVPARVALPQAATDSLVLTYADDEDFTDSLHTVGVKAGSTHVDVYNLLPQHTYYYRVATLDGDVLTSGEIHTEGRLRMIYVKGCRNIRDMGGWMTVDGRRVKYGKLFRGSELNGIYNADSTDIVKLAEDLQIRAELDMRAWYDEGHGESVFGFPSHTTGQSRNPTYYYTSDSGQEVSSLSDRWSRLKWKREFNYIVACLSYDRNVYMHCVYGADRTGYLALLLDGILGLDYSDVVKDYELTSFFMGNVYNKSRIEPVIDFIRTCKGETLQEQFEHFFVDSLTVDIRNIEFFRNVMLEDVKDDDVNPGGDDDDNPTTGIVSATGAEETYRPAAAFDLWGRRTEGLAGRKGFVIVTGKDGRTRKMVR